MIGFKKWLEYSDLGGEVSYNSMNNVVANDGFNKPVRTIKKAAQIAASFTEPLNDPGQSAYDSRDLLRANKTSDSLKRGSNAAYFERI